MDKSKFRRELSEAAKNYALFIFKSETTGEGVPDPTKTVADFMEGAEWAWAKIKEHMPADWEDYFKMVEENKRLRQKLSEMMATSK